MLYFIILSSAIVIFLTVKFGFHKWIMYKLMMWILAAFTKAIPTAKFSFKVNDTDISASVTYEHFGEKYIIFVPYNRSKIASMTQLTATLLRDNDENVNITQQPGIPYMVNADMLGGHTIRLTNNDTGETHDYEKETMPFYGNEVL